MKTVKRIIYFSWLILVIALFVFFIIHPESFQPEAIVAFLRSYQKELLLLYTLVSILRGLVLIPSTPFVIAGAILFPEQPYTVILISMLGVFIGATAIYYFSDFLGFSEKLEKKYARQYEKWHNRLNGPKATVFVILWSFFPLVPTDLICYIAGIVKMRYFYLITGVLIGEIVLIYCYVVLGAGLFDYLLV